MKVIFTNQFPTYQQWLVRKYSNEGEPLQNKKISLTIVTKIENTEQLAKWVDLYDKVYSLELLKKYLLNEWITPNFFRGI